MKNLINSLWTEFYRPTSLNDYICENTLKTNVKNWIKTNDVPHLLLYGLPGGGKTTLAKLIINNIKCDSLYINASNENGVQTVRDKIIGFASAATFKPLKVIILDEADFLSTESQSILRNVIESYSIKTRFIFTANFEGKILDAIKSRCQTYKIDPPSQVDIARRMDYILTDQNIKFDLNSLKDIIQLYYPDIRKIINVLQQYSTNGELKLPELIRTFDIDIIINALKDKNAIKIIRQYLIDNDISDFENLYKDLYNNVNKYCPYDKQGYVIISIADHLYKHQSILDKEINFMSLISNILNILK